MKIEENDILKIFPLSRQIKDTEIISGMSYSRIIGTIKKRFKGKTVDYCDLFIIEFYKRVKSENLEKLIKEYKGHNLLRDEVLLEKLFTKENYVRFDKSTVRWKKYFMEDMRRMPEVIFLKVFTHLSIIIEEVYTYNEATDVVYIERDKSLKGKQPKTALPKPPKNIEFNKLGEKLKHL